MNFWKTIHNPLHCTHNSFRGWKTFSVYIALLTGLSPPFCEKGMFSRENTSQLSPLPCQRQSCDINLRFPTHNLCFRETPRIWVIILSTFRRFFEFLEYYSLTLACIIIFLCKDDALHLERASERFCSLLAWFCLMLDSSIIADSTDLSSRL